MDRLVSLLRGVLPRAPFAAAPVLTVDSCSEAAGYQSGRLAGPLLERRSGHDPPEAALGLCRWSKEGERPAESDGNGLVAG
jgi:hypothetical protein